MFWRCNRRIDPVFTSILLVFVCCRTEDETREKDVVEMKKMWRPLASLSCFSCWGGMQVPREHLLEWATRMLGSFWVKFRGEYLCDQLEVSGRKRRSQHTVSYSLREETEGINLKKRRKRSKCTLSWPSSQAGVQKTLPHNVSRISLKWIHTFQGRNMMIRIIKQKGIEIREKLETKHRTASGGKSLHTDSSLYFLHVFFTPLQNGRGR